MEHYYSNTPTSKHDEREVQYEIQDRTLCFITDHGVFSMDRVDHGSNILLNAVLKEEETLTGNLVDLGCGYGPVGITLATFYPDATVTMIDVNDRAMALAKRNADANQVGDRVRIGNVEQVEPEEGSVEAVITNPPIRAGKETIYQLFRQSYGWLKEGGRLYAVIRKNQGAPSAVKELTKIFGNADTVDRESGFHVIRCIK